MHENLFVLMIFYMFVYIFWKFGLVYFSNMMEEVSDDTNGESTFEFVSDKGDESTSKDNANQSK